MVSEADANCGANASAPAPRAADFRKARRGRSKSLIWASIRIHEAAPPGYKIRAVRLALGRFCSRFSAASRASFGFAHELEETALFAVLGLVLVKERQVIVLEFLIPFVPGNFFERASAGVARKIDAQDAGAIAFAARQFYRGRLAAAFFGPIANRVEILRAFGGGCAPAGAS